MALRWKMLLVLVLVRLSMGYEFQTVASSSDRLVADFGFTYAEVGALIGFFLLPGVVVAIPSGLMTRALADRSLVMIGAAVMVAGSLIMGFGDDADALYTGRLLTGVGGTIFNVILTKMVTDWFQGHRIVTALAMMLAAWPGGIALGLVTQGAIADAWGWPWVMHAASILAALALLLTAMAYRDAPRSAASAQSLRFVLPLREFVHMGVVGIGWTLFNATLIMFISFTPDHLIANGYSAAEARAVTSVVLWIALPTIPLGGRLIEATGLTTLAIVVLMGLTGAAILALEHMIAPAATVIVLSLALAIPAGPLMSLSAQAVRPVNRGPGLGIFYTWYYVGMTAAPVLAGWSRDVTGDTGAPLMLAACMCGGVMASPLVFRLLQRTWPVPDAD